MDKSARGSQKFQALLLPVNGCFMIMTYVQHCEATDTIRSWDSRAHIGGECGQCDQNGDQETADNRTSDARIRLEGYPSCHLLAQVVQHPKQTIPLDGDELLGTLLIQLLGDARLPSEELDHTNDVHACQPTEVSMSSSQELITHALTYSRSRPGHVRRSVHASMRTIANNLKEKYEVTLFIFSR